MSMSKDLKYYKQILHKVSFDVNLFRKELEKAYNYLSPKDQLLLHSWVSKYVANKSDLRYVVLSI
jgi:type IV secretory pathway TrbF-like protein